VFVIATANDISDLPPELLRKGRLDDIFFVDLPSVQERAEIFAIHLANRRRDPSSFSTAELAAASDGFSGAEIEEAINSALYDAFSERRELANEHLLAAVRHSIPLSQTMQEKLRQLRSWAQGRARPASSPV
jgi:SpoVK/Ycf46/Vps4 family AAA+-type ATPase